MWDNNKKKSAARQRTLGQTDFARIRRDALAMNRAADSVPLTHWLTAERLIMLADLLYLLAFALALFIGYRMVIQLEYFSLRRVDITGELNYLDRAGLEKTIKALRGNFLTLDLATVQRTIETVPWIRKVAVERAFPDRITLHLEEHLPLARWRDGGLVNTFGKTFEARYGGPLPSFDGGAEHGPTMTERYIEFKAALAPLGIQPTALTLSARQAWRVELDNGLTLELGREKVSERLKTFLDVYPVTLAHLSDLNRAIDLRYTNGFAITVGNQQDLLDRKPSRHGRNG